MARASLQGVLFQANGSAGGSNTVTLATYVGAVKQVSDMFKSILTQTTDTGQVNFVTLPTLPGQAVVRDFEIYQLGDSLQSTSPVVLRVDYGYASSTSTPINLSFTIGTATDGAGNILTNGLQIGKINHTLASTATYAYLSTDGSQITFVMGMNPTGTTADSFFGFVIERFRNLDGTPSGDGFNVWQFANGSFYFNWSRIFGAATQPGTDVNPPVMIPGVANANSFFTAGTEYAFPFTTWGPTWRGASQALMYGLASDFPRDAPVNITHYGKTAQFIALGTSGAVVVPYISGIPNTVAAKTGFSPLFRWE